MDAKKKKKMIGDDVVTLEYSLAYCCRCLLSPPSLEILAKMFLRHVIGFNMKQVLQNDIDLLNPPAELEKRKHKLKRLVQSPNSFFMVLNLLVLEHFISTSFDYVVNGCEMPRLLQHHYCVQSLADRCCMRKLPDSSVPAYRRKGKAHGRMLFQEEVRLI
ncbi:hypothetical protein HID58_082673 [Brassica napus]|uniref:Uncharacterized protein n=1 Tax=Brassica napus TaxID=3708 RepID=A0ABQ7YB95_BRANA|nr:hypothetical protein HID58_082673 [Brassica napus]